MADPQIPDLGDMLGLPSEALQQPQPRGDLLDYYLGPTGIPDRLRAANEVLNPIRGISDAMYYSGQAFNPDLPAAERRRMAGQAAMETGIAALPVGLAKVAGRYVRAMPGGRSDDAQAVVETMTGATPDLQDPSRRRFMAGMGAAAVAPMLPAEELLATGTRATARGAGSSALGSLLAKKAEKLAEEKALGEALRPLQRTIAAAGRFDEAPPILMTEERALQIEDARKAMAKQREIQVGLQDVGAELNSINRELMETLLDTNGVDEVLDSLDPKDAADISRGVFDVLVNKVSMNDGGFGEYDSFDDLIELTSSLDLDALMERGLTKKEAELAATILPRTGYIRTGYIGNL